MGSARTNHAVRRSMSVWASRTEAGALVVPGQGGGLGDLTNSISEIAAKLNQIPFDDIGPRSICFVKSK